MTEEVNPFDNAEQGIIVFAFGADWCGPWKLLEPAIDILATKVEVRKVDADKYSRESDKRAVVSLPTFVVFKDGKEVRRRLGAISPDELLSMVEGL